MSQNLTTTYFEFYFQIQFHLYQSTWYSGYLIYYHLRYPELLKDLKKMLLCSLSSEFTYTFDFDEKNSIVQLKTEKLDKLCDSKCPICLETFWDIPFVLNCNHFYHKECILNWKEKTCPICLVKI